MRQCTAGDIESVKTFVTRAVNLPGLTPYERSEALSLEGRYFFAKGDFAKGRQSDFPEAFNRCSGCGVRTFYACESSFGLPGFPRLPSLLSWRSRWCRDGAARVR